MRTAKPRENIDTEWFISKAKSSHWGSLNNLARAIVGRQGPLHPAALSRSINGQREFTVYELEQLASLLGVPLLEILRRLGVDVGAGRRRRG